MVLVEKEITLSELKKMAEKMHGKLVKAVVDIVKKIMVVDAELHADEEDFLLEKGSEQGNLWGINIHPSKTGEQFIEFDSMINIRPSWGNASRYVEDPAIRKEIINIVSTLVKQC